MLILELVATAVISLIIGAGVGAANAPTVDKAIAAVTAAEASAKATLTKITAHKAS